MTEKAAASATQPPAVKLRLRNAVGLQLGILVVCLLAVVVVSTSMGYLRLSFSEVVYALAGKAMGLSGFLEKVDELHATIVFDVRLPRILTAAIVGGGLAVSGAVFQGILLKKGSTHTSFAHCLF